MQEAAPSGQNTVDLCVNACLELYEMKLQVQAVTKIESKPERVS